MDRRGRHYAQAVRTNSDTRKRDDSEMETRMRGRHYAQAVRAEVSGEAGALLLGRWWLKLGTEGSFRGPMH